MARNKKTEEPNAEVTPQEDMNLETQETQAENPENTKQESESNEGEVKEDTAPKNEVNDSEPSAKVLELMRLYPNYEELWITPKGFVHPKGAPAYCTKGATLYKNKFYNKNN